MNHPIRSPFHVSARTRLVPVVNADGAYARAIEKWLLCNPCDCLLVPIPNEFLDEVLSAIQDLPNVASVIQLQSETWKPFDADSWMSGSADHEDDHSHEEERRTAYYIPIDPSQAVIAALRFAIGEHIAVRFADAPSLEFSPLFWLSADAYVLRNCSLEAFASAMLPAIPPLNDPSQTRRLEYFASQIHQAERDFQSIVALCPLGMWPWLRQEYAKSPRSPGEEFQDGISFDPPFTASVEERSLSFFLAELPFATGLSETLRNTSDIDPSTATVDFVKHLLITARQTYYADLRDRARKVTPLMLNQCMQYIRNLTLLDRRLTPDLYTIALAAKQIIGDQYAIHVIEASKEYPFCDFRSRPSVRYGISELKLPEGELCNAVSLLDSVAPEWRSIELNPRPKKMDSKRWKMQWNPYAQCSWPPEDVAIESFRSRLMERAQNIISADLAQSEKFSTSILDGIDIRETLRHWYDREVYVKRIPPSIGKLDACIMLFDVPADPRDYPWRSTWFAEHQDESTLAFFATNFRDEMLGPGVALATYGGSMFLYPPRPIEDIWQDERLDFCDTVEQRLIAGACANAEARQVVLMSPIPPTSTWRKTAKRFGKKLVHLPMNKFSDATIQQLRMFHVLNGKNVRSYASQFIRRV